MEKKHYDKIIQKHWPKKTVQIQKDTGAVFENERKFGVILVRNQFLFNQLFIL